MEEKDLQQEAQVIIEEENNDYDQLLKKFENPTEYKKPKKNHKALKIVISIIAVAVLAGAVTAMLLIPSSDEEDAVTTAKVTAETDADNVWQASPATNDKGSISQNGTGTLIKYDPAEISKITVKNELGAYTVKSYTPTETTTDATTGEESETTSTTEYTLVGYEDFELQSGNPDSLASDCAAVNFNKIIEADASDKLADYGLDNPRAVATVIYTDGTKAIINVGSDALQGLGTYISFGNSNAVYIVDTDAVDTLLLGINNLISLTINESSDDGSDFKYVNLTGSAYEDKITLEVNNDTDCITNSYLLTAPISEYADNDEASGISGSIRGLAAEEVVCLNPTAKDLKAYGLNSEYAHLVAKYSDTTINLIASKPDDEGVCYLMNNGGNVIYSIGSSAIPWVTTTVEKLTSDYVLAANLQGLDSVTVTTDKKYKFETTTTTTETTDEDGNASEATETTAVYNSQQLTTGNFEAFYDNISLLTKSDTDKDTISGKAELTITYSYTDDRDDDVVKFYKDKNNRHIVTVNSKPVGHVFSSYVEKLIDQTSDIAQDKKIDSLF